MVRCNLTTKFKQYKNRAVFLNRCSDLKLHKKIHLAAIHTSKATEKNICFRTQISALKVCRKHRSFNLNYEFFCINNMKSWITSYHHLKRNCLLLLNTIIWLQTLLFLSKNHMWFSMGTKYKLNEFLVKQNPVIMWSIRKSSN